MGPMTEGGPDGRAGIDADLVRRLVAAQFPRWRDLPVTPVAVDGWDNRTYRLGDAMTVRLPTGPGYAPAVAKESRWLPFLAPSLPVAVPTVLGNGVPGLGYPYHWSVRNWLPGRTASHGAVIADLPAFAVAVAEFLRALQRCDPTGGPAGGAHSFYRGASVAHYEHDTLRYLARLAGRVDTERARTVWDAALAAEWRGTPVWFHGDVAAGNLLVVDGALSAVIDFGTSGVGDPACDLVIAWTMFDDESRGAFRDALGRDSGTDDGMWARARGWALWKALLVLTKAIDTDPADAAETRRVIDAILDDHYAGLPASR